MRKWFSRAAPIPSFARHRCAPSRRAARAPKCCSSSASSSFLALSSTATARPMFRTDDGAALAYDVRGDGLPLVLVNGLPDTKDGWNNTAIPLAPYFRVATYNLPNQGLAADGGQGCPPHAHLRHCI